MIYYKDVAKPELAIFDLHNELVFKGKILDGKKQGVCTELKNSLLYEGDFTNDQRSGQGSLLDLKNKIFYSGEFLAGRPVFQANKIQATFYVGRVPQTEVKA